MMFVGTRQALLGGGGLLIRAWDDFTDADGTALESHTATDGGTWTKHGMSGAGSATIDTNRLHNTNDSTLHGYYHSWSPGTPDYAVSADVILITDNNLGLVGPMWRVNTAANTFYLVIYGTGPNGWRLYKSVTGTLTQIGSDVGQVLTANQRYRVEGRSIGSRLLVTVDGAIIFDTTDTAITAAGKAGVYLQREATSSVGVHLDAWRVRA